MLGIKIHPEPSVHAPLRESDASEGSSSRKPAPASVTSSATGFPATPASGKPSGLLAHLPPAELTAVTLPGDPAIYFIKSTSNASGAQALYTRAPQTGVLKQTSKQVLPDGHGGWKLDGGLPGGGQGSSRAAMSNPATRRPLLSEEQKQEAIARANSAYKTAQNELGDAKKRLNDAEQDLKMIERTHGPSGDLWSAVRPPSPGPLHHPSPQEYALHELRRPGYPIEWAALRELQIPNDPNWVTSFKPGKERAQAEDAVAKAQRQVEAAQKKVDDADQSLQEAMHAPSVAVRSSGEESVERSEK